MLVITRKRNQVLQIGDNIRLHVLSTGRNAVKLAIEAPREVPILRAELCPRVKVQPATAELWVEMPNGSDETLTA